MKLITVNNKKFIVGMTWRWPSNSEVYSKKEIQHLCDEVRDGSVNKGVVLKPKIDTSGGERRLINRTGLGLVVPISSDEMEIEAKSAGYFSLGQAFCSSFPNAIIVTPLDDGSDDWWFCASIKGSVVTGTDFYGTRASVLEKASEWAKNAIFLYQNIDSPKMLSASESAFFEIDNSYQEYIDSDSGKSLSFIKMDLREVISSSSGLKRIGQIRGINLKLFAVLALFLVGFYFAGNAVYDTFFSEDDVGVSARSGGAPTPQQIAERIKKAKALAGKARTPAELMAIEEAKKERLLSEMDRNLRSKMLDTLTELITKQNYKWVFAANEMLRALPYSGYGYTFEKAICDHELKCEVQWSSDTSVIHDPKSMEALLGKWTPKNPVINDLALGFIKKVFEFKSETNRGLTYKDLERLPVVNFFINDLMEKMYFVRDTEVAVEVKMGKPNLVDVVADTPDDFNDATDELAVGSFVEGTFTLTLDGDMALPIATAKVFDVSDYMAIRSFTVTNTMNNSYRINLRGGYVSKKD